LVASHEWLGTVNGLVATDCLGHGWCEEPVRIHFVDDDARSKTAVKNTTGQPPVLAVYVNAKEVKFFWHIVLAEKVYNAVLIDELTMQIDGGVIHLTIHEKARPAMLTQPPCIAFHAVLHTKLHIVAGAGIDQLEGVSNDPIFAILRVFSELCAWEAAQPREGIPNPCIR
jgi:hypothetical protein